MAFRKLAKIQVNSDGTITGSILQNPETPGLGFVENGEYLLGFDSWNGKPGIQFNGKVQESPVELSSCQSVTDAMSKWSKIEENSELLVEFVVSFCKSSMFEAGVVHSIVGKQFESKPKYWSDSDWSVYKRAVLETKNILEVIK